MIEGETPDVSGGEALFPIVLAPGIRLREVPEGFRIRHLCKSGNGDKPTDIVLWNAPLIDTTSGKYHSLVSREPLTIVASVLCPSCKLHGYIRDGTWHPC